MQALHTCPETRIVTGIRKTTAAHMSRAVDIQHAFGLGFTRAKAPDQWFGDDDWHARGVTWACRVVIFMRNVVALLCALRPCMARALGGARNVTLDCRCRTHAAIGLGWQIGDQVAGKSLHEDPARRG